MWQEQVGCLEMLLAYYGEVASDTENEQSYRDFLFDILCWHQKCLNKTSAVNDMTDTVTENSPDVLTVKEEVDLGTTNSHLYNENYDCCLANDVCESLEADAVSIKETDFIGEKEILDDDSLQEVIDNSDKSVNLESCRSFTHYTAVPGVSDVRAEEPCQVFAAESTIPGTSFDDKGIGNLFPKPSACSVVGMNLVSAALDEVNAADKSLEMDKSLLPFGPTKLPFVYLPPEVPPTFATSKRGGRGGKVRRPYSCLYCFKSFTRADKKVEHERVHLMSKPFSCSFCQQTFKRSGDKNRHERVHTNGKPYTCSYCPKSFTRYSNKIEHERVHTKERPYRCRFCDRAFAQLSTKSTHEQRAHVSRVPTLEPT